MDVARFDALTRVFARPASRRRVLGLAVAAALVPLATVAAPKPAGCRTNGRRCTLRDGGAAGHGHGNRAGKRRPPFCTAVCCSRHGAAGPDGKARCACKQEGAACADPSQCCGGLCRAGTCTKCPNDLTACDGACVDRQTDAQHCGDCAVACDNGQRCVGSACVCDAPSCPRGCCGGTDGTTCQRGTSDQACGIGGATCQACATCTTCDGTACVAAEATCCGDAAVCQGGTCVDCAAGQHCRRGACVCDETSCAGCCDGDMCVPFDRQSNAICGTGGQPCVACTAIGATCGGSGANGVCGCTPATACSNGQACGTAQDGCGGTINCRGCAGCCDGNTCNDGASDTACGKNGRACVTCVSPATCGGGNPGTLGVCGCTRNCTGKCAGESDGCDGTCACPTGQDCVNGACFAGQGTCPTGANLCASSGATTCNGNDSCICAVSTEGDTICASIVDVLSVASGPDNLCGVCQSSQDCIDKYPTAPGVFCLRTNAPGSACCTDFPGMSGLCQLRCSTS